MRHFHHLPLHPATFLHGRTPHACLERKRKGVEGELCWAAPCVAHSRPLICAIMPNHTARSTPATKWCAPAAASPRSPPCMCTSPTTSYGPWKKELCWASRWDICLAPMSNLPAPLSMVLYATNFLTASSVFWVSSAGTAGRLDRLID